MTRDWSWRNTSALYEQDYGVPKGLAVRSGSVWTRQYEKVTISDAQTDDWAVNEF